MPARQWPSLGVADSFQAFDAFLTAAQQRRKITHLAVAVSGGSDSTALLLLAKAWAGQMDIALSAVTIDHQLRPEAAAEASQVADLCKDQGIPHKVIPWTDKPKGNVPSSARDARYHLISTWAAQTGVDTVLLGHTEDDQAENTLLRLLRGSGVDGLSAMRTDWDASGTRWLRPCLGLAREDLRAWLTAQDQGWIDDPSNSDPKYDRVKARQALAALTDLGITRLGLVETSQRMTNARHALEDMTSQAAHMVAKEDKGVVSFDLTAFVRLTSEIQNRLLAHTLCWIAGQSYRPRFQALSDVKEKVLSGRTTTLHGCLLMPKPNASTLWIFREHSAVQDIDCPADQVWDHHWQFEGRDLDGLRAAPLGEQGLSVLENWRETGLPRAALMAAPALWRQEVLVACPHAAFGPDWQLCDLRGLGNFRASICSI